MSLWIRNSEAYVLLPVACSMASAGFAACMGGEYYAVIAPSRKSDLIALADPETVLQVIQFSFVIGHLLI